jgi:hypothetical protein
MKGIEGLEWEGEGDQFSSSLSSSVAPFSTRSKKPPTLLGWLWPFTLDGAVLDLVLFGATALEVVEAFHHQAHARGEERTGHGLHIALGEVLVRVADAHAHSGDVLGELAQVLQLGATTGEHDASDELLLQAAVLDLEVHVLQDLLHAALDDLRERSQADLLGLATAQTGDAHHLVLLVLRSEGTAERVFSSSACSRRMAQPMT